MLRIRRNSFCSKSALVLCGKVTADYSLFALTLDNTVIQDEEKLLQCAYPSFLRGLNGEIKFSVDGHIYDNNIIFYIFHFSFTSKFQIISHVYFQVSVHKT